MLRWQQLIRPTDEKNGEQQMPLSNGVMLVSKMKNQLAFGKCMQSVSGVVRIESFNQAICANDAAQGNDNNVRKWTGLSVSVTLLPFFNYFSFNSLQSSYSFFNSKLLSSNLCTIQSSKFIVSFWGQGRYTLENVKSFRLCSTSFAHSVFMRNFSANVVDTIYNAGPVSGLINHTYRTETETWSRRTETTTKKRTTNNYSLMKWVN